MDSLRSAGNGKPFTLTKNTGFILLVGTIMVKNRQNTLRPSREVKNQHVVSYGLDMLAQDNEDFGKKTSVFMEKYSVTPELVAGATAT